MDFSLEKSIFNCVIPESRKQYEAGTILLSERGQGGFDNMPAANFSPVKSSLPRMIFSWNGVICGISVVVSNLSCILLCSFFFSILPTKRNLLTHLDTALVLAITALVNALVSAPIITKIIKCSLHSATMQYLEISLLMLWGKAQFAL